MKRRLLVGFTVLSLALCALPALAAAADPEGDALLAAIFAPAPAPDPGVAPQPQDAAKRPRITPKADCTARCWNGVTLSCSGPSCSGVDSNCPAGVRGSCTGAAGTTLCPACPGTCTVTATCSPSGSVSCTSSNNDCVKVNNCYVQCDGIIHWCPTHGACPV